MKLFLIILLAMVFIAGPVLMLRPSERERRLSRIRLLAQKRRINVRPIFLRRDPFYSATLERNPHLDNFSWTRYQLVAVDEQTGPSVKGKWVQRKTPEGPLVWEPEDVRQKSVPAVDALIAQWQAEQKPDFLALELGPRSAALVWNEKGDVAETESLCDQLEALLKV